MSLVTWVTKFERSFMLSDRFIYYLVIGDNFQLEGIKFDCLQHMTLFSGKQNKKFVLTTLILKCWICKNKWRFIAIMYGVNLSSIVWMHALLTTYSLVFLLIDDTIFFFFLLPFSVCIHIYSFGRKRIFAWMKRVFLLCWKWKNSQCMVQ